jgi:DNA-binding NarL/FixJ family response regulator
MPPRILIVDDSAMIRGILRQTFESEPGWQVSGEAGNGQEGIEKAQLVHPNFILLDLSMPVMNGLEAARALTRLMPNVPLVMFTSFMTGRLEIECRAAGIKKVFVKSCPLADLIGYVRSLMAEADAA